MSITTGIVKGLLKTKGMSIDMRILHMANESLKSFNKNKGSKILASCISTKKCLCEP